MATTTAKAARRGVVHQRLAAAAAVLAERFDITPPEPRGTIRDAELAATVDMERMADLFEAVIAATDKPEPKQKGGDPRISEASPGATVDTDTARKSTRAKGR